MMYVCSSRMLRRFLLLINNVSHKLVLLDSLDRGKFKENKEI